MPLFLKAAKRPASRDAPQRLSTSTGTLLPLLLLLLTTTVLQAQAGFQQHSVGATASKLPICIGVLAYQGVATLNNTLSSYATTGLMSMVNESVILFQDVSSPARAKWAQDVLRRFPLFTQPPIIKEKNTGFAAFRTLAEACHSKYILILEEDFVVSRTSAEARAELLHGTYMISHKGAHAVWMRNRKNMGYPDWVAMSFKEKGEVAPTHAMHMPAWDDHAEEHSKGMLVVCHSSPKTWCAHSQNADFTNNPVLYRHSFLKRVYKRLGDEFGDIEQPIKHWWHAQNFTVAWSQGLFTHNRLDREQAD